MTDKPTREKILDAAERMFAFHGGENAVSMRDVAKAADVRLSLLSYHFGAKADLYRAIFDRRVGELANARQLAFAQVINKPNFTIRDLAEAFVRPSVEMQTTGDLQGRAFALLTAYEASHPNEAERGILEQHYDPMAKLFIDGLTRLYPDAPRQSVADAYLFMVGALVMSLASGSRFARLGAHASGGKPDGDTDKLIENLIDFCSGGVHAMLAGK